MIHFRPQESGVEEQRTEPVALCGSEQRGGQGCYSEQSVAHQVQPRGLHVLAAFLLELPRKARQRSTVLHHAAGCCVFSRPDAVT